MISKFFRSLLTRGAEAIFALALVLVCFLVILFLLSLSFPLGTGLRSLWGGERSPFLQRDRAGGGFSFYSTDAGDAAGRVVAVLSHAFNKVKDKPANGISWINSRKGADLGEGHAVQTLAASSATISFGPRSHLQLGPNSLVVLKRLGAATASGGGSAQLVMLGGELRATLAGGRGALDLQIASSGGTAQLRSLGGRTTDVQITANPDGSSTYAVLGGVGELSSRGRTLVVGSNQAVRLDAGGSLGGVMSLPATPSVSSPADGEVFRYRETPPRVRFAWDGEASAEEYRVVIARDARFREIAYQGAQPGGEMVHGNLTEGSYYWKASGVSGQLESPPTQPRQIRLVRDDDPPPLRVAFPQGPVDGECILRGSTEPGAKVFVGEAEVSTSETGEFEHRLELAPGLTVVTVEAVDVTGNVSYRSQVVHATSRNNPRIP